MGAETQKLDTGKKIDLMFDKLFIHEDCITLRLDRIEQKLDHECPVGRSNSDKLTALAWAGGIVVGAVFSVIGFFHFGEGKQ